jgi:hypothetical protein
MMFKKDRQELYAVSIVMDAIIALMEERGVMTKNDIRIQILKAEQEAEKEHDERTSN